MFHRGRRPKQLYAGSTDPKDAGLGALTWDYPTEGEEEEPSAGAVFKEMNGYTWPERRQIESFQQLKDEGRTACGGWLYCGVYPKAGDNRARALPADDLGLRGTGYDNTGDLSATRWRHVHFMEHIAENGERATEMPPFQSNWLMMSDVCKRCSPAPCLQACPTGALFRTEFHTAGHLQWLRLLRVGLPVWHCRCQSGGREGA